MPSNDSATGGTDVTAAEPTTTREPDRVREQSTAKTERTLARLRSTSHIGGYPGSPPEAPSESLRRLARLHGVQTMYYDVEGQRQPATAEALRRVVAALGTDLGSESEADLREAASLKTRTMLSRPLPPVAVAWGGRAALVIRLPEQAWPVRLRVAVMHDCDPVDQAPRFAETISYEIETVDLPIAKIRDIDGVRIVAKVLEIPDALPLGYHRAGIELGGEWRETLLLSSPVKAYSREDSSRRWGVFAPLYSVQSDRSWGAGDLTDLSRMMDWIAEHGGDMVATLPLLPPQSENSDDPSPYSAGSRLMWNDLYLDLDPYAEPKDDELRRSLDTLRRSGSVAYDTLRPLRRQVLAAAAAVAFDGSSADELQRFADGPDVLRYARFQAECERTGKTWFEWPEGHEPDGDLSDPLVRRHVFAQLALRKQLDAVGRKAVDLGQTWYLDYPLGVNAAGYDVWAYRDQFALSASGGAPPDAFFTKGQNWGFPPMHPDGLREDGYRYFLKTIRHHLRYAKLLRFDHVMGLYRLFWVPHGLDARDGAYVRYPMDELIAVLAIESVRAEAELVGENLGTVPPAIRTALPKHGIWGMYVTQFGVDASADPPVAEPSSEEIASVNTHDMPTFAAFASGHDIADRLDLGLMKESEAADELRQREKTIDAMRTHFLQKTAEHRDGVQVAAKTAAAPPESDLLAAVYRQLGESDAPVVLASLDDLVDELTPQNTPGTFKERPNWSRKLAKSLDELAAGPVAMERLRTLADARKTPTVTTSATGSVVSGTKKYNA